jgi:type I restriction enzyme S subunit
VPEHWEVLPGRAVFREINDRGHPDQQMLSVTITRGVLRQTDLLTASSKKDSSNEDKSNYKLVQPGDLVYNKMRAWQGAVGVSSYRGIVSPAYIVQRLRSAENLPRYMHFLLRTPLFAAEAERWSYGITSDQWSLRTEEFKRIYFSLPPLPEQTAIVRFLEYMDRRIRRVIHAGQRQIKLLAEYRQALIHQAVTGQIDVRTGKPYPAYKDSGVPWLGQVPEHWEVRKLKYAVTFVGGGTPSKTNPSFWEGQIPWVSPKDMKAAVISDAKDHINDEAVAASSTSIVGPGAVLLVVRSGILRTSIPVAINLVPVALNQDMKALRPKHALLMSGYLRALIQGNQRRLLDEWTRQGATVESIEHEYLANSDIPLPPCQNKPRSSSTSTRKRPKSTLRSPPLAAKSNCCANTASG